jgi:predicted DNA-binding transcriptional regulator YafY
MLAEPNPDERPPQPTFRLVYELDPAVARNRDLARWFPDTEIMYRDDGSALVSAQITNLWQARQILMRYIQYCQVLEPPELVEMMRHTAAQLVKRYEVDLPS